jgi:hypothetical protein
MGTSHLDKQDNEWLYLHMYVHNDPDELPEWYNEGIYPQELVEITETIAYEICIDYRVNKNTYKVEILNVSGLR